jgi:hypothetical protein
MRNTNLLFLLSFFTFLGCSQRINHHAEAGLELQLKLLEGRWMEMDQENYAETWASHPGDTMLTGAGFSVQTGVFTKTEKLAIVKSDTSIFYQATVEGQNQGATIPFKWVKQNTDKLVFENPAHDFPQRIEYNFLTDSTLEIKVGSIADTSNYFRLRMRKEKLH